MTLRRPRYTQIDPSDRPCRRRWVGLPAPHLLGVGVLRPRRLTPWATLHLYLPPSPLPIFPLMPHYLVLCTYAVRSGYA